jgi:Domain of unknown function (DUF5666)
MDPSEPEVRFTETIRRSDRVRIGLIAGAVLVAVCSVAVALAASPSPSPSGASPDASAVTAPTPTTGSPSPTDASPNGPAGTAAPTPNSATQQPGDGTHKMPSMGGLRFGFGGAPFEGHRGGSVFGPITVTAVNGSSVSLKTADGWTRTITVGDSTTVTRGGAPAKVSDIKVGDTVRLDQDRASDGTYTVSGIDVILPTVAGQVTAKTSDTITITLPGGTTSTVHVGGSTAYTVAGKTDASLSDVTVGSWIVASGTQRSDGSLDATSVHAGAGGGMFRGPGGWPFGPNAKPNASPGATTSPG